MPCPTTRALYVLIQRRALASHAPGHVSISPYAASDDDHALQCRVLQDVSAYSSNVIPLHLNEAQRSLVQENVDIKGMDYSPVSSCC